MGDRWGAGDGIDMERLREMEEELRRTPRPRRREPWDAPDTAKETILKQREIIDRLTHPPFRRGAVLSVNDGIVSLATGSGFIEVINPPKIELSSGDLVVLTPDCMQIVDKLYSEPIGKTATFVKSLDDKKSEVVYNGSAKIVFSGSKELEKDDRVILDTTASVIIDNLGKQETKYTFDTGGSFDKVSWDDIGGLEEAKRELIQAVEMPHKFPKIFKHYNKKSPKGILLYGPPGCGKTMLGKATATSLNKIFKGSGGFIYVKAPELLNRYVGATEETIRAIFQQAQEFKKNRGFPAVLFLDEADAILPKRGSRTSSDMDRTIVPMFLSEMDGLEESGALVMLVTNRPDVLDSAVVREGRIDIKIGVGRPTPQVAYEIFLIYMKRVPLGGRGSCKKLSVRARDRLFSPEHILYRIETRSKVLDMTLGHITSGSMIASIVERASSMALQRDISKKTKTGILSEDIDNAVLDTVRQHMGVEHKEELSEFVGSFKREVVSVRRGE